MKQGSKPQTFTGINAKDLADDVKENTIGVED